MRRIFPGAPVDELVGASALHIEPDFARDMKSHFPDIGIDDVIALRTMGIDCDFVTDMERAGMKMRGAEDAIELRAAGGPRGTKKHKGPKGTKEASVILSPGVIEARGADGRVARLEMPQAAEPPAPPALPGG